MLGLSGSASASRTDSGGCVALVTRKAGVMAGQSDPLTAFALDKDF